MIRALAMFLAILLAGAAVWRLDQRSYGYAIMDAVLCLVMCWVAIRPATK